MSWLYLYVAVGSAYLAVMIYNALHGMRDGAVQLSNKTAAVIFFLGVVQSAISWPIGLPIAIAGFLQGLRQDPDWQDLRVKVDASPSWEASAEVLDRQYPEVQAQLRELIHTLPAHVHPCSVALASVLVAYEDLYGEMMEGIEGQPTEAQIAAGREQIERYLIRCVLGQRHVTLQHSDAAARQEKISVVRDP